MLNYGVSPPSQLIMCDRPRFPYCQIVDLTLLLLCGIMLSYDSKSYVFETLATSWME